MLTFLREVRDDDAVYDVYLKKIVHRSDGPLISTPDGRENNRHHHHHHHYPNIKFKLPHRQFIKKLFKISKSDNNNDKNNHHNIDNDNNQIRIKVEDVIDTPLTSLSNASDDDATQTHPVANQIEVGQISQEVEGHLIWSTKEVRVVKYCTLKGLIRSLTAHDTGEMEPSTVHVFLATYRSFSNVGEVLKCLITRYEEVKHGPKLDILLRENILKSLKMIFLMWILLYPSDFSELANQNPGPTLPSTNHNSSSILDTPIKYYSTNQNKPLKFFKEFLDTNLDIDVNVDKHLIKSFKAVMANRNINNKIPIHKLSCNCTSFPDDDDDDDDSARNHYHNFKTSSFFDFTATCIAELLTRMDADLFINVSLHQCLGSVWGKRNKLEKNITEKPSPSSISSSSSSSSTVQATVKQFNAVVYRIMTCVLDESLTSDERAKVIQGWISVAQECRRFKNFSSLKAILSALQTSSIHRLTDTWSLVEGSYMSAFHGLALLMSDVDNHKLCRDILEKEGTGKSPTSEVTLKINKKKPLQTFMTRTHKSHEDLSSPSQQFFTRKQISTSDVTNDNCCEGTVPFLGTFLTDLAMIDTAHKDFIESNEIDDKCCGDTDFRSDRSSGNKKFINFVKKQKEWEVLVRMEILQKAASLYRICPNIEVYRWMEEIPVYREPDYYKISLRIQSKKVTSTSSATLPATRATKLFSSPSSLATSLSFSSIISLDSLSSSSSSSSLPSSSSMSPSPFCKPSRLSTVDDSGVVLLKFSNYRRTPL